MSLHPGAQYGLVSSVRLVGMMLLVYARRDLQPHISLARSATVGTGREGKMVGLRGNKGAVGVSLRLHQTSLCLVNSHLAAHQLDTEKRNEDFHHICSRLEFGLEDQSKDSDLRRIEVRECFVLIEGSDLPIAPPGPYPGILAGGPQLPAERPED